MRSEHSFVYDYGQVYLYDAGVAACEYVAALEDAHAARRSVGVDGELVDVLMPLQWNFEAPLVVEVASEPPAEDFDAWEHVVDFALRLPTGRLVLEGSGGSGTTEVDVEPGEYRARWSGRGFPPPGDHVPGDSSADGYRLQLWRAPAPGAPLELKRWPGYDVMDATD